MLVPQAVFNTHESSCPNLHHLKQIRETAATFNIHASCCRNLRHLHLCMAWRILERVLLQLEPQAQKPLSQAEIQWTPDNPLSQVHSVPASFQHDHLKLWDIGCLNEK